MSDLSYERCPKDGMRAATATLGVNPENGEKVEVNIHAAAAILAVHSAIMTLSSAIKTGVEDDFLERIVLGLIPKVDVDPHSVCPLLNIMWMLGMMTADDGAIGFSKDGHVLIVPKGTEKGFVDYPEHVCPLTSGTDEEEIEDGDEDK